MDIPPGFATPLAKIVPESINVPILESATVTTPIVRHAISRQSDHQGQGKTTTFSGYVYVKCGQGRPPKQRPSALVEAPPIATKETPAVPLPPAPAPPLGSSIDAPVLIPCDADDGKSDNKIKLDPLLKLKSPPKPRLQDECSSHINEESKTIIFHVKSLLVYQLTSGRIKTVEAMVKCANIAFSNLDMLGADYTCFYKDVEDFITHHYELLTKKKRNRAMQSFPELKTRYEDAISSVNGLKDDIFRTQGHLDEVISKKEPLERRLAVADAIEHVSKLKQLVSCLEEGESTLKHKKQKQIAALVFAQQEVQKLRAQVEAPEDALQCENAIESSTRRLKSIQSYL